MSLASLLSDNDRSQLDETLVTGVVMGFPGISVALGNKSGLLWAGAAGYRDIVNKEFVDPEVRNEYKFERQLLRLIRGLRNN